LTVAVGSNPPLTTCPGVEPGSGNGPGGGLGGTVGETGAGPKSPLTTSPGDGSTGLLLGEGKTTGEAGGAALAAS
jgi:hypothetical protein